MTIKDLRNQLGIEETNCIYHRSFFSSKHLEMYNSYHVWKEKKIWRMGERRQLTQQQSVRVGFEKY